jgi:hypothetical protein
MAVTSKSAPPEQSSKKQKCGAHQLAITAFFQNAAN